MIKAVVYFQAVKQNVSRTVLGYIRLLEVCMVCEGIAQNSPIYEYFCDWVKGVCFCNCEKVKNNTMLRH